MDFIIENYQLIALIILVADKVVAMTPNRYDDIIVSSIKKGLRAIFKSKNKTA